MLDGRLSQCTAHRVDETPVTGKITLKGSDDGFPS